MILYVTGLGFALVTVLAMLTLVAYAVMGVITVGSLWSLLPLSVYALAFWLLAQLAKDM